MHAMGEYTVVQERALAITPKCCASLSIPCSVFLIYEVWCDHRKKGSTPIQRALVGMSMVDILRYVVGYGNTRMFLFSRLTAFSLTEFWLLLFLQFKRLVPVFVGRST